MLRAAWLLSAAALLRGQPMDFTGEAFYFRTPQLDDGRQQYRWTPAGITRVSGSLPAGLFPATKWTNDGEYACGSGSGEVTAVDLATGKRYTLPDGSECLALFPGQRALVMLFRGGRFTWQWAFWHFLTGRLELTPLGGTPVQALVAASYDGNILLTSMPGATAALTVHYLAENRVDTLGSGMQIYSLTADATRYTGIRFTSGDPPQPRYVLGWTREPGRELQLGGPALLSPAGNALFLPDREGGWWREDFATGAVERIVMPLPTIPVACNILAPGGICLLGEPVRPDLRFTVAGRVLPVERVPDLGGVVRIPADVPLGDTRAEITSTLNPLSTGRPVRVVASGPRVHTVLPARIPEPGDGTAPGERLTLVLSGWGDRRPACFAYPYAFEVLGPVERIRFDQWENQGGLIRAAFRLPALDFRYEENLASLPPRTAAIDCGYQPGVGAQFTVVPVR